MISRKIKSGHVPNEKTGRHENQGVGHVFEFLCTCSTKPVAVIRGNGGVFGVSKVVFYPTKTICDDDRYIMRRINVFLK